MYSTDQWLLWSCYSSSCRFLFRRLVCIIVCHPFIQRCGVSTCGRPTLMHAVHNISELILLSSSVGRKGPMAVWKQEENCSPERCCGSCSLGTRPLGLLFLFSIPGAGRHEDPQAWSHACRWPYASIALGANPLLFADGGWGEGRIYIPIPKGCCTGNPGRSIP